MSKTILIIDDSAAVREVTAIALRAAGYEVLFSTDGKDAQKMLDGRKLHLIICDVNMPDMDGITFLKVIKTNPHYKFTPVMMLTTDASESKKEEGRAAGAKAWMVKPFKPDALLRAVQKLAAA
jgi:two-component system, chemotaxis family, chemotaxis protein CheY